MNLAKYWGLMRLNAASSVEYRTDFFGMAITNVIEVFGVMILWVAALWQTGGSGDLFAKVGIYYLATPIAGSITYVVLSNEWGKKIKDGDFSTFIVQPLGISRRALVTVLGKKIAFLSITIPAYLVVAWVVMHVSGWRIEISNFGILAGLFSLVAGFLIHFVLDLSLSFLAFFVDDIWSFAHFKSIALGLLGGMGFPLDLAPGWLRVWTDILPFRFMYHTPIAYFLGRRGGDQVTRDVVIFLFWLVIFALWSRGLLVRGLKKYGAFGN